MFKEYEQLSLIQNFVPYNDKLIYMSTDETEKGLFIFYSPHCDHCVALEPEINLLNQQLRGVGYNFNIRVAPYPDPLDSGNEILRKFFEIKGFPNILYQRDNIAIEFKGASRSAQDILEFIYNMEEVEDERAKIKAILSKVH